MSGTTLVSRSTIARSSRRRGRALTVGAAVLVTSTLWLAARILHIDLRVDMRNGQPPMVVELPLVITFSLVAALLGWATLALLERFTSRGRTIWRLLAAATLLLSFLPIVSVQATTGAKTVLALMHIAVAAVLIPALPGGGSRRSIVDPS